MTKNTPKYRLTNTTKEFTINPKTLVLGNIEPIGSIRENESLPEVVIKDGEIPLLNETDYQVKFVCGSTDIITVTPCLATAIVTGKGNYSGTVERYFGIYDLNVEELPVVWETTEFTYNGNEQGPEATLGDGTVLEVIGLQTNAGSHTAVAQFAEFNPSVKLSNDVMPYTIYPKPLTVIWSEQREFTYNKMVQHPEAKLMDGGTEITDIDFIISNAQSAAGVYKLENHNTVYVEIIDNVISSNHILENSTVDYTILKKSMDVDFAVSATPQFEYDRDTLWVSSDIFSDSTALHKKLIGFVNYDNNDFVQAGTDPKTGETFDADTKANSITGDASINLAFDKTTSPFVLSKRVETTRTATAVINNISSDNYALTRHKTVYIMETPAEGEETILCLSNGKYIETYSAACLAFGGEIVDEETPILQPALATGNSFRVWQNSSGIMSLDLGYVPANPVILEVRNMQGKLVASKQISSRYANISLNASNGMYVFKAGKRSVIKALK